VPFSVYDSFEWMDVWGDPSYNYHKMMAQVLGTLALNLASDLVIGFNHTYMARILVQNAQGIASQLAQMNGTVGPPGSRTPDHTLDLDRLNSVIADFAAEATTLITSVQQFKGDMETKRATVGLSEVDVLAIRSLNDRLMYVERAFIMPEGIPGETWYKHVVTSPSLTNSYAGAAYPAVSDALGLGQWRTAQRQLDALCHLIVRATNGMKPVIPY
jgi:N-acetylated-alpha-linked acidic dipeptidase